MAEVTTPVARLASEDFGPKIPPKPVYSTWLRQSVLGWGAFAGFLLAMSWLFLALTRLIIWIGDQIPVSWGLSPAIGTILSLILVLVMITATLLTMADRKWSALMQDRVGPNRARFSIIPGLRDIPRWIPVHRLIWRDWNRRPAGPVDQPGARPEPAGQK